MKSLKLVTNYIILTLTVSFALSLYCKVKICLSLNIVFICLFRRVAAVRLYIRLCEEDS